MHNLVVLASLISLAWGLPSPLQSPSVGKLLQPRQHKDGEHGAPAGDKGHDMGSMGGSMGGGMGRMMGGGAADYLLGSGFTAPALQVAIGMFPKMQLFKKEDAKSAFKKTGAKKMSVWYGPLELPSIEEKKKKPNDAIIAMDPQGTVWMNQADKFPANITILHGTVRLKYADGSPADVKSGVYNHHVVFIDTNKRPLAVVACPGKSAKPAVPVSVMLSTGEDNNIYQYASEDSSFDGGYYVGKNDNIWFTAELVNYASQKKTVYAVVEFDYIDGKSKLDVTSENLSVTQCDSSIGIRPPKGQKKFNVESKPMKVEHTGSLFGIRGHLHDGGTNVLVNINGKTVCTSKAQYGKGGNGTWDALNGNSICPELIPVKKGDTMTITAQYDLDLHPARQHAEGGEAEEMGLALFSFAADAMEEAGSAVTLSDLVSYLGIITTAPVVAGIGTGIGLAGSAFAGATSLAGASLAAATAPLTAFMSGGKDKPRN